MEETRSLVKSKPLEELFLQAEKNRSELVQAAEEKARRANETRIKFTLQAWAEEYLLTKEKLDDEQIQALLPYMRKWHARRFKKGLAGLGAWILFQAAAIGMLIGVPVYVSELGVFASLFLVLDFIAISLSCTFSILALYGDNVFRDIFESYVLHPARFLMHGHYKKLIKPEKVPSIAIG